MAVAVLFCLGPCAGFGQLISAPQPSLTVASSHLPDWDLNPLPGTLPHSFPGAVPAAFIVRPLRRRTPVPPFLASRWNRTLVAADFGVRMLDAFSSWMDRPANCRYCAPEVVLPQAWSNSLPTMLVFSTTVSASVDLSARFLWRRHHARLARIVLLSDMAGDGEAGIGNVRVYARAQRYAAAVRARSAAASSHP
ncbi:MAG TPA: hypothetical protein VGG42_17945 [Acidobacteriaceae bacterium]